MRRLELRTGLPPDLPPTRAASPAWIFQWVTVTCLKPASWEAQLRRLCPSRFPNSPLNLSSGAPPDAGAASSITVRASDVAVCRFPCSEIQSLGLPSSHLSEPLGRFPWAPPLTSGARLAREQRGRKWLGLHSKIQTYFQRNTSLSLSSPVHCPSCLQVLHPSSQHGRSMVSHSLQATYQSFSCT